MKIKYLIVSVFLIGVAFTACEYTPFEPVVVEIEGDVDFEADVEPIFSDAGCTGCHNGGLNPNLTAGNAFQSLTSEAKYTDLNEPNNIYEKARPGNSHPANYSPEQAAIVLKWIEQYNAEN
ncbi:MAG: hypothetical protein C0599_14440 [Salinivirgaceae bacterium]|nr:MAG: hypothetical protein C0599_14440 [Salinivirgaceae bacterium]